eukprot:symbB.v1.2.030231.t1/scaffold3385.1/size57918/1
MEWMPLRTLRLLGFGFEEASAAGSTPFCKGPEPPALPGKSSEAVVEADDLDDTEGRILALDHLQTIEKPNFAAALRVEVLSPSGHTKEPLASHQTCAVEGCNFELPIWPPTNLEVCTSL